MAIEQEKAERYLADMKVGRSSGKIRRDFRTVCLAVLSVTPMQPESASEFRWRVIDALHSSYYRPVEAEVVNWEQLAMVVGGSVGETPYAQLQDWQRAALSVITDSSSPEAFLDYCKRQEAS